MATEGGETPEAEMVPAVSGASGLFRSVAGLALVHGKAALLAFTVLEQKNTEHYFQCMDACPRLSFVELSGALFLNLAHKAMMVCSVVQMLMAVLALVSTVWFRRLASFVVVTLMLTTGTQSIRLLYTALFGTNCCFSGGVVQVAVALAVAVSQLAIPFSAPETLRAPNSREH